MTEYENQVAGVNESSKPSNTRADPATAKLFTPGPQSRLTAPILIETTSSAMLVDISGKASIPRKKRPSGRLLSLSPFAKRSM